MTDISLKEYFDSRLEEQDKRNAQRFDAQEKAVGAALAASEKAVLKAEGAAEKRFESVNEFRGALDDRQRTLMPRTEAELRLNVLEDWIKTRGGESSGFKTGWALAIGIILFAVAVVGWFK